MIARVPLLLLVVEGRKVKEEEERHEHSDGADARCPIWKNCCCLVVHACCTTRLNFMSKILVICIAS